jgi:hypothetical protein
MYNGTPTLTLLSFLRVNSSSVSLFYGSAPWHYYLIQALPLLAGPALPFILHGAYLTSTQGTRSLKLLLYTVIWTGVVFSFAGHKEWRFLHPMVPAMHILAARSLVSLYDRAEPPSQQDYHITGDQAHPRLGTCGVVPGTCSLRCSLALLGADQRTFASSRAARHGSTDALGS